MIAGRRRELGLGGYPATGLTEARALAHANKSLITAGRNPVAERRRTNVPTFREAAKRVFEANLPRWRNGKQTKSWWQTRRNFKPDSRAFKRTVRAPGGTATAR